MLHPKRSPLYVFTICLFSHRQFRLANSNFKADYGNYGERKYPTYGDYYRTHRYPINDGWMLWDEDLRDLDSKSNKIGSGKDGGR